MTRLQNVNTTDIAAAIRLGCRTMQNVFNADDNNIPFFGSHTWPYAGFYFHPDLSEAHVPGRHLNALLAAEEATGFEPDPEAIENHRRALFFSFSGPVALPLNRQEPPGPLVNFGPHNVREAMHGMYALVRWRSDEQARELARRYISAVFNLWDPVNRWDKTRLGALGLNILPTQGPLNGEVRMIGPLVKYYLASGYAPALELALLLKEHAVERFFWSDGDYDYARFITDHTHSITSSLSSLAQLADLLDDEALMGRVKAFYDNGLWQMRDEIGWSPGGVFQRDGRGEGNNSGDMLETALVLGRRGYPQYYHDAERMLRCTLLPSQLRDNSFLSDSPNPENLDRLRNAADRHLGAFGMPAPYGFLVAGKERDSIIYPMDVVGSVVSSLCAACLEIARWDKGAHWVNLLFDRETPHLRLESPYTHDALRITLKQYGPLFVRLPPWLALDEVRVEGANGQPFLTNGYLFLAQPPVSAPITLRFPLKESSLTLSGPVHPTPIRLRLRGDGPVAMENFGQDLTFFDSY
jgi:hypothetical protein